MSVITVNRSLSTLLLVSSLVTASYAGDDSDTTPTKEPVTLEQWLVGKDRKEIVEILGPPNKTKKKKTETVLVYEFSKKGHTTFSQLFVGGPAGNVIDETGAGVQRDNLGDLSHATATYHSSGEVGLIRRIEIRLDLADRVTSSKVVQRKTKASKSDGQ